MKLHLYSYCTSQPSQEICKQGTPQKNTFCYNAQQARLLWLVISSVQQRYNWLLQSKAMKRQQSSVADELESTELSMGDHHIFSSSWNMSLIAHLPLPQGWWHASGTCVRWTAKLILHMCSCMISPKGVLPPRSVPAWCNTWRLLSKLEKTLPQEK